MSDNPYRLPRNVLPERYDLTFEPDLEAGSFIGSGQVTVNVKQPTDRIVLNGVGITVTAAGLDRHGDRIEGSVETDADGQRLTIVLPGEIEPGPALLDLEWTGTLDGPLVGFYRSKFTDTDGMERTIASTQFEATDARRAFPCWDEPDLKAVFSVTLVVPEDLMAISNTTEIGREVADGKATVRFADTMKMSTYLVAMVVGPFEATEPLDVDGVPVRVIAPLGKLHLSPYALECAAFTLRYLRDYYGIPYPGDKLDHVAVPDFGFGAMENLGCVIYREAALLLDLANASQAERLRVLDVIGHETAHMWFGDLVTMEWWEGIWLNEAFATFMEVKATDASRPDWKRWLAFGAIERPWAYGVDALQSTRPVEFEVGSPEEANEMFDALTYGKGSAILRMMEQYIGEEAFRRGVGDYLVAHEHANTVTADLWKGLDGASGVGVGGIMDTWILQRGFPQVEVRLSGPSVTIAQRRYLTIPDESDQTRWRIPIQLRGATKAGPFEEKLLLTDDETTVSLDDEVGWLTANADGWGFYRTLYPADLLRSLVARLGELTPLERYVIIDDAWAFVESGQMRAAHYLELASAYGQETEQSIWQSLLVGLAALRHHVVRPEDVERFQQWADRLIGPAQERLGVTAAEGDDDLTRRLRGQLVVARGRLAAHQPTIDFCRKMATQVMSGVNGLDPEIARAALFVTGSHGGRSEYDQYVAAHQAAGDPQAELRYLQAIASFDDPDLVKETVSRSLDGRFRKQDATFMIGSTFRVEAGPEAWAETRRRWDEVVALPSTTLRRMVEGISELSQPEAAADVTAFFAETPVPAATKAIAQNLERLKANVALREREGGPLGAFLAGPGKVARSQSLEVSRETVRP
ncbi:MAG TPA: M1 family metallopeptidase [Acidimicrobiia bacterium]